MRYRVYKGVYAWSDYHTYILVDTKNQYHLIYSWNGLKGPKRTGLNLVFTVKTYTHLNKNEIKRHWILERKFKTIEEFKLWVVGNYFEDLL
jgi:hypothetical protein